MKLMVRFILFCCLDPCYVGSSHHRMARPRIFDGGDDFHIGRVAANIFGGGGDGWARGRKIQLVTQGLGLATVL